MPEKFLFLLILLTFAPFGFAGEANTCDLKATLNPGRVERFWNFGTDSWDGEGQIICHKADEYEARRQNRRSNRTTLIDFFYKDIYIRFESWIPGFGPLAGSSFEVSIKDIPLNGVSDVFGSFRSYRSSPTTTLTDSVMLIAQSEITQLVLILKTTGRWDESYLKNIGIGQILITLKPEGTTR